MATTSLLFSPSSVSSLYHHHHHHRYYDDAISSSGLDDGNNDRITPLGEFFRILTVGDLLPCSGEESNSRERG